MVKKDLRGMGLTWEEAEVAALNRQEWRRSVATWTWDESSQVKSSLGRRKYWYTKNSFIKDAFKIIYRT